MKCKYDEYFVQRYNDGELSIEEKSEFEKHLGSCDNCSTIISNDRALLRYLKEDNVIKDVPATSIVSQIDLNKYKASSKKYKVLSFLNRWRPSLKVTVPALALSLIIIIIASNPMLSEIVMNGAASLIDKHERVQPQYAREISIEEINNTVKLSDNLLVRKLNEDGMGVAPWEVSYADDNKVFFRNYASLVGYKNGHIYRVADLKAIHADHIQGSVISEFKFNPDGTYVAIGNFSAEEGFGDEYKSNIYMLNTETGSYFVLGEGNYANICDNWSFNGRYYVIADKNKFSDISFFDSEKKKLYAIDNPGVLIDKIFVTDEGFISFSSQGNIYFLNGKDYDVEKKVAIGFDPLFIDGKHKTAIAFLDGAIVKYNFGKGKTNTKGSEYKDANINEDDVLVKNNRFVVFRVTDGIGIYDLKKDTLNSLSPTKLPSDGYIDSLTISPDGARALFTEAANVFHFGKDDEGMVELSYIQPSWMSNSEIVYIELQPALDLGTSMVEINAGEFAIITYNVESKQKNVVFKSVDIMKKTDSFNYFINTTNPSDGASDIVPEYPITVIFNVDMDNSTLNTENISIWDVKRSKDIVSKYNIEYDREKKELVIKPTEQFIELEVNDSIQVRLKPQIKDLDGNNLPGTFEFVFHVRSGNIYGRTRIDENLKDTVVINDCLVKNGPGEDNMDVGSLKYGDTIYVKGNYKGWYLAMSDTVNEFWIDGKNLIDYSYEDRDIGIITAASISVGKAETKFNKGNLVWIIKRDGEKSFVRPISIDISSGYSGWINNQDYTLESEGTYFNQCLIKNGSKIYKEPDENSDIIHELNFGTLVFSHTVNYDKNKGWVNVELVDPMLNGWVKFSNIYLTQE